MANQKRSGSKAAPTSGAVSLAPTMLTPAGLVSSKKRVRQVTVPGLGPDGEDAILCHYPFTSGQMMQFQDELEEANKIEEQGGNPKHIQRIVGILSNALCDQQGKLVFSEEVLKQVPAELLVLIMTTIAKSTTAPLGKGDSNEQTSDSPTG